MSAMAAALAAVDAPLKEPGMNIVLMQALFRGSLARKRVERLRKGRGMKAEVLQASSADFTLSENSHVLNEFRRHTEASAMLESATQGGYMFYNSFGGVAGMYAAVEDCVRDERNRQQALQDEMEGTLEARYGMDPAQFSGVKVAPPELTEI